MRRIPMIPAGASLRTASLRKTFARMTFATALLAGAALAPMLVSTCNAQTPPAQPAPAAAPAVTPPPAPLPPPNPEAVKSAATLTDIIGVNRQGQQLIAIMRGQMIQLVMRSGSKSQDDAVKIVDEVLMPDFLTQQNELQSEITDVWARDFTLDDLNGLIAFYKTPLGQKLIATLPAVTQQGMQAGQAWGQKIYQASIQKHKDELILRGLKF